MIGFMSSFFMCGELAMSEASAGDASAIAALGSRGGWAESASQLHQVLLDAAREAAS